MLRRLFLVPLVLAACTAAREAAPPPEHAPPSYPPPPSFAPPPAYGGPQTYVPPPPQPRAAAADASEEPMGSAESFLAGLFPGDAEPAQAPQAAVPDQNAQAAPSKEMLDIEAWMNLMVEDVADAASQLRAAVRAHGGGLTLDQVYENGGALQGTFDIRVPAGQTEAFLAAVARLGRVLDRNLRARDVSKEYQDNAVLLRNLDVTLKRYEEMLAKANTIPEMLQLEQEMARLRTQMDQVKGTLRWIADRVAMSTIHITLRPIVKKSEFHAEAPPEAKFYPGVRGLYALELRAGERRGHFGFGLSLAFAREFSFDLDLLDRNGGEGLLDGADLLLATFGGETYSEFIGYGRRKWLNPYLGWRLGYVREERRSGFALGVTVGLEIVKVEWLTFALEARGLGLVGGHGTRVLIEPAATLNVPF